MSKADKMFEELGYEKKENTHTTRYVKLDQGTPNTIEIDHRDGKVSAYYYCIFMYRNPLDLNYHEIVAIQEKMEEEGGYDE